MVSPVGRVSDIDSEGRGSCPHLLTCWRGGGVGGGGGRGDGRGDGGGGGGGYQMSVFMNEILKKIKSEWFTSV